MVIQCDSGHKNANLIACARYRIYDELVKPLEKRKTRQCITHTLFVIYLPPQVSDSTFVGFQGDPWVSSHIDELMPTSIAPQEAVMTSISEIFIGDYLNYIKPLLGDVRDENQSLKEGSSTSSEDQVIDTTQGEESDIEVEDQEFEAHELTSSSDSRYQPTSVQTVRELHQSDTMLTPSVDALKQNSENQIHSNITEELLVMDIKDISDNEHETTLGQSDKGSLIQHLNSSDSNPVVSPIPSMIPLIEQQENLLASKSTEEVLEVGTLHPDDLSQRSTSLHSNQNMQVQEGETQGPRKESGEGEEIEMTGNGAQQQIASHTVSVPTEFIAPLSTISDTSIKPKILPVQYPTAQCKRLYGCIQSAVSRTEDANNDRSTDRVKHLIKLIPKDPEQYLSELIVNIHHT